MKLTNFDRDNLNPALANASTLSDASMVLNDLVLKKIKDVVRSLTNTRWRVSQKWISKMMGCYLGGSYSRASNGILVQETETLPTFKKKNALKWYGQCSTTLQILTFLHFLIPLGAFHFLLKILSQVTSY